MKRILLTTTSLVLAAGVAQADVSFSGTAEVGYNDHASTTKKNGAGVATALTKGVYSDADLNIAMSAALDNGMSASASFEIDYAGTNQGGSLSSSDSVVSFSSDVASVTFGDTKHAAQGAWSAVGSMDKDAFRVADGENVTRVDVALGGMKLSVSEGNDTTGDTDAMTLGLTGTVGSVSFALAHQNANTLLLDSDDNGDASRLATTGVRASTTMGGAAVAFGYAKNTTGNSTGVSVSYPMGAFTANASYVAESVKTGTTKANWDTGFAYTDGGMTLAANTDESSDWNVDASFALSGGATLFVGADDAGKDTYAGVSYGLGNGATLVASYAKDDNNDDGDDEVGAKAYKNGMTIELSFAF